MTRSWSTLAVLAVVASLLVVTAPTAQAATVDDLASINTTDTDFQNATTLDDLDVSGSGQSANVVPETEANAAYNPVTVQGDGSNDDHLGLIGDYGSNDDKFRTELRVEPDKPLNDVGALTLNLTVSDAFGGTYNWEADIYAVKEAPDGTYGEGTLIRSGWSPSASDGTQTVHLDTNVSMGAGETWTLEFVTTNADNDGGSDHIDIRLDDSFSNTWYQSNNRGSYDKGADIDLVNYGPAQNATYVGQAHNADRVETGFVDLTLDNASADVEWQYYDSGTSSWTTQRTDTYTSSGNKSVSWSQQDVSKWRVKVTFKRDGSGPPSTYKLHDEGVKFAARSPSLDNSSASPSGNPTLSSSDVDLQIDVSDPDFATGQGDEVTVTYWTKAPSESSFSKEGTTSVTSNGTASLSTSFGEGGEWEWYATAEDTYGETSLNSSTSKFTVPSTLTLRNETPNHGKITNAQVQLIFYEDTEDNPTIVNRTVTNGEVDLGGLPVGTQFAIYIDSPDHHTRTVLLDSIYDQDTVYLLSTDEPSVEQTFDISDNTGRFPASETELLVQRAINDSVYDANGDGYNWTTVAGDDLSASGSFTVDLEPDTRYRLIIENENGDRRVIGAHTPTSAGTVTITVSDAVLQFGNGTAEYDYNATLVNPGTSNSAIKFKYQDRQDETGDITVRIYEYGNQSNVLLDQTYSGPYGNLSISQPLTQNQSNKTWVVEASAPRGDDSVDLRLVVGKGSPLALPVEQFALQVAAIGIIVVVPSMFPGSRDALGAVMASLAAMLFWWYNVLPPEVGASAIAFALMAAYLWKVRKRKGAVQ